MNAKDDVFDDSRLLANIAQATLARSGGGLWKFEPGDFWCVLTPPNGRTRDQGWKLHVSATQLSAPVVLARAAEVLVRAECAFKFAKGLDQLSDLLSSECDRGSGGKFITAYPADDEQFRQLAAEIDRVTDGLPGPVILSDRQLRPGSLVYYRYGVFSASSVLNNDGSFDSMLVGPDGQRQADQRLAWFSAPPWAVSPLPEPAASGTASTGAKANGTAADKPPAVLIGDRFVVREAIRHSYRGGVYRATDQQTGAEVILKQARPHVMGLLSGTDARDALRHEAEVLDLLSPLGFTPRKVALVTHQENVFLAEELVSGVTLRRWAAERSVNEWQGRGAPPDEAIDKARQLVELMAALHAAELVLRDFTPNNVMVTADDRLRLVDLEHATTTGSRVFRAYTMAYAGGEQMSVPRFGPAPSQRSDLFSLGATVMYLASGIDPLLPPDNPAERSVHGRLRDLVTLVGARMAAVRRLGPLILGLTHDDPDRRWDLDHAREFLATAVDAAVPASEVGDEILPDSAADRLLSDGLRYILRTMSPRHPRLWNAGSFGDTTDPCSVQHGAAGVLAVLTRSARILGEDHLREGVATVAGWIDRRLFDIPRILPGLYFGRSGTAWALYDAARFLGDDTMAGQAVKLAKQVPVEWPNPDICHGAAGAGMAQFHLWKATGDPEFERRGIQAADHVLQAATDRDGLLVWPIPATFDSALAGLVHYGFAHGVAGAGTFLLYSNLVTGRPEYLEAARRAGETLQAVADVEGDAAWWPSGEEGDSAGSRMRHWCSGSSGVGTFLIRLWLSTGEQRFRDLAEAAGAAIRRDRWYSSSAACHGLAGDAEFLLDLADFTGEQRYRDWAGELAAVMHVRHTIKDGLAVLPDESGLEVTAGYNTGLSGAMGFLLRLRHGGSRWWMLDELLVGVAAHLESHVDLGQLAGAVSA